MQVFCNILLNSMLFDLSYLSTKLHKFLYIAEFSNFFSQLILIYHSYDILLVSLSSLRSNYFICISCMYLLTCLACSYLSHIMFDDYIQRPKSTRTEVFDDQSFRLPLDLTTKIWLPMDQGERHWRQNALQSPETWGTITHFFTKPVIKYVIYH